MDSNRTLEQALAHAQSVEECPECKHGEHENVLFEDVKILAEEVERLTALMKG